jgi:hypothetical protein
MDLIQLVVILMLVGVLLWLVNTYVPMDHGREVTHSAE